MLEGKFMWYILRLHETKKWEFRSFRDSCREAFVLEAPNYNFGSIVLNFIFSQFARQVPMENYVSNYSITLFFYSALDFWRVLAPFFMHNASLEKVKNLLKLYFVSQFCPPLKSYVILIQKIKTYKIGYKNIYKKIWWTRSLLICHIVIWNPDLIFCRLWLCIK